MYEHLGEADGTTANLSQPARQYLALLTELNPDEEAFWSSWGGGGQDRGDGLSQPDQSLWDTVWWSYIAVDGPSGIYFCFSLLPFHGRDRLFGTSGLSYVCPSGRTGRVGGASDRGREDLQDNGGKVVGRAAPLGQTAAVHAGPFCAGRARLPKPSYHCA